MDIEWAKDGKTGELFIVQARPETVHSSKDKNILNEYRLDKKSKILIDGIAVGGKIGAGKVRILKSAKSFARFALRLQAPAQKIRTPSENYANTLHAFVRNSPRLSATLPSYESCLSQTFTHA